MGALTCIVMDLWSLCTRSSKNTPDKLSFFFFNLGKYFVYVKLNCLTLWTCIIIETVKVLAYFYSWEHLWCPFSLFQWCETQKECNRLRLVDILVQPMQRLTKYSLLLKAILKKTTLDEHKHCLHEMVCLPCFSTQCLSYIHGIIFSYLYFLPYSLPCVVHLRSVTCISTCSSMGGKVAE